MKKLSSSLFALAILSGCASTEPTHLVTSDTRACAQNFTTQGNLLTGMLFKTHDTLPSVTKKDALSKTAKHIAIDGWHITNSDVDLGILSAAKTVSFGDGKTAPLNITFDEQNNGVKASIAFSTSSGVASPSEAVMKSFCEMITIAKG